MKPVFWNGAELTTPVEVLEALCIYREQHQVTAPMLLEFRAELLRNGSLPVNANTDAIASAMVGAVFHELTRA